MNVQKGQFWERINGEHIWVRFIFQMEGERLAHYLEYIPNGVVPYQGSEDILHWNEYFTPINCREAEELIKNMAQQDAECAFRLANKDKMENLAQALKILERKRVSSVDISQNVIRVSTDNGASYEIAMGKEGFTSRQTGLPDPW